ncbi:MAG: phosphate ABC transporter permease subunit PstC, partial [Candidatus Methanoplasma sp.]|nr:phosphate ABC transporter permease subunit PstC [Candidatus Methanoplasma sp.]
MTEDAADGNTREGEKEVLSHFSPRLLFNKIIHGDKAKLLLTAAVVLTVAILFLIIIFVSYNSMDAVRELDLWQFFTGSKWSPNTGTYGAASLITGTFLVAGGAIMIALPIGLGIAIFINDVASPRVRAVLKPMCELFAGIPSVVYGFIGMVVLNPILRDIFPGHLSSGASWLSGSLILGLMALPTIISVTQDALGAVPRSYREASMAMGATKWETTRKVVMHSAVSGIAAATILGIGRALGETIAVMMVCGNVAMIPEPLWNIFSYAKSLTAAIASEMGDVVYGSIHFSALFLLALVLMVIVLIVNLTARRIVLRTKKKMGEIEMSPLDKKISAMCRRVERPFESYKGHIKDAFFFAAIFALGFMISDLFIGMTGGIAVGAAAAGVLLLSKRLSRFIGPKNAQKIVYSSLGAVVVCVMVILVVMIGIIVVRGLPAISFEFIFDVPTGAGRAGGIWPAIVGSMELLIGTALISFPLGICAGVYFAEYAKDTKLVNISRQAIDALSGTPSIIFGLFGMSVFVIAFGWGYSLIGGCATLALMVLPTIIKTTEEAVIAVPNEIREASMAMGASKWHTVAKVVLPASMGGVITGFILSMGRAIGETAPIMFTASVLFKLTAVGTLLEPVMALPYHLYFLVAEGASYGVPEHMKYGTALVLMAIVVVLFASASLIRRRYN